MALTKAERAKRYSDAIVVKACSECGVGFSQRRASVAVCSEECRAKRGRRLRPQSFKDCEACGARFGPVARRSARFCSITCKSRQQSGQPSPKRGKRYPHLDKARAGSCLTCGAEYKARGDWGARRQSYCSHRCYLKNRRVSRFEASVGEALTSMGIAVEHQVRIGRFVVDFVLTGTRIVVEADGDYWHSFDEAKARDRRKNEQLHALGYILYRIPEHVFNQRGNKALSAVAAKWEAETGRQATR